MNHQKRFDGNNGYAGFCVKGLKLRPGQPLRCVLVQDTKLLQFLSLHRIIDGYSQTVSKTSEG